MTANSKKMNDLTSKKTLHCPQCGQQITEKSALARERKRLAADAKEKAEEQALEKATDAALAVVKQLIKTVNAIGGPVKITLDDYYTDDNLKHPVDQISLAFKVAGVDVAEDVEFDYSDAVKMLRSLASKKAGR